MKEDFAEYTKCMTCGVALLCCDCNCPYCGLETRCNCLVKEIKHEEIYA